MTSRRHLSSTPKVCLLFRFLRLTHSAHALVLAAAPEDIDGLRLKAFLMCQTSRFAELDSWLTSCDEGVAAAFPAEHAYAAYKLGDFHRAKEFFALATKSQPSFATSPFAIALDAQLAYAALDYARAARGFEQILALDPDDLEARANLVACHAALADAEAAETVAEAESIPADFYEIHFNLGCARLAAGLPAASAFTAAQNAAATPNAAVPVAPAILKTLQIAAELAAGDATALRARLQEQQEMPDNLRLAVAATVVLRLSLRPRLPAAWAREFRAVCASVAASLDAPSAKPSSFRLSPAQTPGCLLAEAACMALEKKNAFAALEALATKFPAFASAVLRMQINLLTSPSKLRNVARAQWVSDRAAALFALDRLAAVGEPLMAAATIEEHNISTAEDHLAAAVYRTRAVALAPYGPSAPAIFALAQRHVEAALALAPAPLSSEAVASLAAFRSLAGGGDDQEPIPVRPAEARKAVLVCLTAQVPSGDRAAPTVPLGFSIRTRKRRLPSNFNPELPAPPKSSWEPQAKRRRGKKPQAVAGAQGAAVDADQQVYMGADDRRSGATGPSRKVAGRRR
jgi:tetratricopeptide (TPR) repeat protein